MAHFFNSKGSGIGSKPALDLDLEREPDFAVVYYRGTEAESPGPMYLRLRRTDRTIPEGQRRFWQTAFDFATERGGGDLDETIAAFRSQKTAM